MPKMSRTPGILAKPPLPLNVVNWLKSVNEEWFSSQTAFLEHVVHSQITGLPETLLDSLALRAVLVLTHFEMTTAVKKCPVCNKPAILQARLRGGSAFHEWTCSASHHNHFRLSVQGSDILKHIPQQSWLAFINFIALLRLGQPLKFIYEEIKKAHGKNLDNHTLIAWRRLYQEHLQKTNIEKKLLQIGGKTSGQSVVVVIDETQVGTHPEDGFSSVAPRGIRKYAPAVRKGARSRPLVRARIAKRLPARTIWKRPAAKMAMKKAATKTGTSKDKRSNGRWLWAGVTVGVCKKRFTHENGQKRFTFRFLPKRMEARDQKPRGLAEIRATLKAHVKQGSMLVFDKWKSTKAAAKALGFTYAPPVNHQVEFRDRVTGFHSNDIESENSRLKHWSRVRYGTLSLNELDLHEYAYYTNVGNSMKDVMAALR